MVRVAVSVLGLWLCLAFAPAAADGPADLEPAFRNTIVSTYPDGRTARLWLNRDGSYHAEGRDDGPSSGRWTRQGSRICIRQRRPFVAPFSYCTEIPRGDVGTSWTARAVTGEMIRIQVIAGR